MHKILYTKYKRGFLVHFFQKMVNFKYAKKLYISMVRGVFWCYVFLIHGCRGTFSHDYETIIVGFINGERIEKLIDDKKTL